MSRSRVWPVLFYKHTIHKKYSADSTGAFELSWPNPSGYRYRYANAHVVCCVYHFI